ncbi:uncharacterized protein FMAN_07350 [Fusarium mangiferae]|uniref:Uncharacterized protein n=1 Tax=Fusarium mangiferae TaxID=192010 RepID=A0A1L7T1B6_FUSMA|nr:uncharacterized protein FMAN_07350 [Fusarium mangiferae]CVK92454.1 uncharacterized protein FMAN_07350 [Fusarium mangiferae]
MSYNEERGALGVRLALGQTSREPRVIQIACCHSPTCLECRRSRLNCPYYFRVSCRLSTFLQQDLAELGEDEEVPLEAEQNSLSIHNESDRMSLHRYVRLQHPGLPSSNLVFHPEVDILWLHFDAETEIAYELRRSYGRQLDHFKNVIVEETGLWGNLEKALEIMRSFRNIQIVHVWLESNRYDEVETQRTTEELLEVARKLQMRDRPALRRLNWVVNYVDDDGQVYGGFRANSN